MVIVEGNERGDLSSTAQSVSGAVEDTDCISGYDTKQYDGEVQIMLEFWGMRSTPSLPSLPGPLWPRVVAPDRLLSMGKN